MHIVAITGPSASGKTWLAERLRRALQLHSDAPVFILPQDAYYRDNPDLDFDARAAINYDHPEAFDLDEMRKQLLALKSGQAQNVPAYDYAIHRRKPTQQSLTPPAFLLVEGILLLHDERLSSLWDLSLFLDTPLATCLERRLRRDVDERGRSSESVLRQFKENVEPMYRQFILPFRDQADIVLPADPDLDALRDQCLTLQKQANDE